MRKSFAFELTGGLDEVTQPLALDPGRAIACLNHEVTDRGYSRCDGFERFDGRTSPSEYPFYFIAFTDGSTAITAGQTITGATSGATGVVLVNVTLDSGAWDGTGTGSIGFRSLTGNFTDGEDIQVSAVTVAVADGTEQSGVMNSGDTQEQAWNEAARDYGRSLIGTVTGSGVIRGVFRFGNTTYAIRDNAGATAAVMFKSTASGWSAVDLGYRLDFTSGGSYEVLEGDTITGATSTETATVERVVVTSGTWSGGDAAGYLVISSPSGAFQAENLDVGANANVATIAGDATAITLPAGGRYFTVTHNFYGASDLRRVYGVNGVGTGFEFDGTVFVPIETGMTTDTPNRVAVFRNQLFFAYPGGSLQHSSPGEPIEWTPVTGAAELGIGTDIADLIVNTDSLIVLGEDGVFALTGYDSTDWQLSPITLEAGAYPYTGQRFGPGIYLDNRGLRSVTTTQQFGNFNMATFSAAIVETLKSKRAAGSLPIASAIVRTKNHYRLFFDDGTGISFYLARKFPEPMLFDLGKVVSCICSDEDSDGSERVFFGSSDGYVYELDKGISFDGEAIEAFVQLPYANLGAPNILKRLFKTQIEIDATPNTSIGFAIDYDYASTSQPFTAQRSATAQGGGGIYGIANWGEFYWGAPVEDIVEASVDGCGRNASLTVYSDSAVIPAYALRGVTYYYANRGAIR